MYKSVHMDSDNDKASFGYWITTRDLLKILWPTKICCEEIRFIVVSHSFIRGNFWDIYSFGEVDKTFKNLLESKLR